MKKLVCLMLAGALALATPALDLTPYETRARKDTVPNTAQLVTDVDMVGLGNAVADAIAVSNGVFGVWFAGLFGRTNYWEGALQPASTNGWEVGAHKAWLTSEADLAALRLYHYGRPDIIESPTNWFTFDGAGAITGIDAEAVTNWNIAIPWQIGGVPVMTIGTNAFAGTVVSSLIAPKTLVAVKNWAFQGCTSLKAVVLPSVTEFTVAEFSGCSSLLSVTFSGNAPHAWENLYVEAPNVTNYVTDPHATGWGKTFPTTGDYQRPVIRLALHADALTLGGVTQTEWPSADVSGLATTQSVNAVAGVLDLAAIVLNNHTDNRTIGSDGHASSIEKEAWNGKVSAEGVTNIIRASVCFTNGTTMVDGVLNGTNGVFFTKSGNPTNYWILLD